MTKNEFYDQWLHHFAFGISEAEIEKYVVSTGNLIWHIFSWELRNRDEYLAGEAAKRSFDRMDKSGARYMEWFQDDDTKPLEPNMNAASLDQMMEVYVAAEDFSWTYIKTHESTCGPYFMKL